MSITQFYRIIMAHRWMVIGIFTLTLLSVLAYSLFSKKTFQASTSLVVNLQGDTVTGNRIPAQLIPGYMATQVDIIASPRVAKLVVDRLGLYNDKGLYDSYVQSQKKRSVKGWISEKVIPTLGLTPNGTAEQEPGIKGWIVNEIVQPYQLYQPKEGATLGGQQGDVKTWIAHILLRGLQVIPSRESSVITIKSEAGTGEFAALLANTFAAAYIDTSIQLKKEPSQRVALWFEKQVEQMRQNLFLAETKLSDYKKSHGIVYADERLSVINHSFAQKSQQLVEARSKLFNLEAQNRMMAAKNIESVSLDVVQDPLINQLQNSLTRAEIKLNELEHRVGKKHPEYLSASSEVKSLQYKLNRQIRLAKAKLRNRLALAKSRVADLEKKVAEQKIMVLEANEGRSQLSLLQQEVDDAQRILSTSSAQLSKMRLDADSTESDVTILAAADAPSTPSKPRVFLNLVLAVILGSILAVGGALLMELFRRKVRSVEDLSHLALPLLGRIPKIREERI